MGTILKKIEYSKSANEKVVEMTNYLDNIIQGFPDVVIIKRGDNGIIVVPTKAYEQSLTRGKNILTYWSHRDYITLDIRPYLIANSKDANERQSCRFYNLSELEDRSINEMIVKNYERLKD
ncbi:hypothetical protein ACJDU8_17080 [Clostridium sp. WILCCON 0269]|uniref:Antitoxin n=1 Tax=Candidatus Clostridium eludens TaxID=3381663 RepID=A0ABW8SMI2_9CLOT